MSLPETLNWCDTHQAGHIGTCDYPNVAVRVAGPNDLVIRREDEFWFETEGVWLNRIFYLQPGKYAIRQLESYDAAVDAALVAAEGEEE